LQRVLLKFFRKTPQRDKAKAGGNSGLSYFLMVRRDAQHRVSNHEASCFSVFVIAGLVPAISISKALRP